MTAVHADVVSVPFRDTWFRPPSETLACAPDSKQTTAVHADVLPVPFRDTFLYTGVKADVPRAR